LVLSLVLSLVMIVLVMSRKWLVCNFDCSN
jgi:hypothetical protein